MMRTASLGTLATAAGLLIGGAVEAWARTDDRGVGALLIAAGLIVLGSWLALETIRVHNQHEEKP